MIAVLGAFDGFHKGHAFLFEHAKKAALNMGLDWGVVTFDSHPGYHVGTIKNILFTLHERELIRRFMNIPELLILKFDDNFAHFSPDKFWDYLREHIKKEKHDLVDGIVVGRDFRFGYRRTGDAQLLEQYCNKAGIFFQAVDLYQDIGIKISSSIIRAQIEAGQCELATKELGYPYFMVAQVGHGLERGRKIGFPTANLDIPAFKLTPPNGVYATAVFVNETWKAGALSIGKNPTFDDIPDVRIEVFVLDYEGDLYNNKLLVFFLSRLRSQIQFKNPKQLAAQIKTDVEQSRLAFALNFNPNGQEATAFGSFYKKL